MFNRDWKVALQLRGSTYDADGRQSYRQQLDNDISRVDGRELVLGQSGDSAPLNILHVGLGDSLRFQKLLYQRHHKSAGRQRSGVRVLVEKWFYIHGLGPLPQVEAARRVHRWYITQPRNGLTAEAPTARRR
jgi:hypothetical protein